MEALSKQFNIPNPPSTFTRGLDLRYPSNRFVIGGAIIAFLGSGAVALAYSWESVDALRLAISFALSIGLAWATTRELDPDHAGSALAAMPITAVMMIGLEAWPNIIAGGVLMLAVRLLTRSAGIPPRLWDGLGLMVVAAYFASTDLWLIPLAVAGAFWLDYSQPGGRSEERFYAAGTLLLSAVIAGLTQDFDVEFGLTSFSQLAIIITVVAFMRFVLRSFPEEMASVGDFTQKPLLTRRVVYANTLMALTLMLIGWLRGESGLEAVLPMWAAFLGMLAQRGWVAVNAGR
jgi:hypothetical protein